MTESFRYSDLHTVRIYYSQREFTSGVLTMAAEGWRLLSIDQQRHPDKVLLLLSFGLADRFWKPRIVVEFSKDGSDEQGKWQRD